LSRRRIRIGLDVEAVGSGKTPKCGLSWTEDVQRIRRHSPNVLGVVRTGIDNRPVQAVSSRVDGQIGDRPGAGLIRRGRRWL
jgi:hypothetical protein